MVTLKYFGDAQDVADFINTYNIPNHNIISINKSGRGVNKWALFYYKMKA